MGADIATVLFAALKKRATSADQSRPDAFMKDWEKVQQA